MGGTVRGYSASNLVSDQGRLGFHEISNSDFDPKGLDAMVVQLLSERGFSAAQLVLGQVVDYLHEMGIDPRTINLGREYTGENLNYPPDDVLREYGIINAGGYSVSPMELDYHSGGIVARKTRSLPLLEQEFFIYCTAGITRAMISYRYKQILTGGRVADVGAPVLETYSPSLVTSHSKWDGIENDDLSSMSVGTQTFGDNTFLHFVPTGNFWNTLISGGTVSVDVGPRMLPNFELTIPSDEHQMTNIAFKNCLTSDFDVTEWN